MLTCGICWCAAVPEHDLNPADSCHSHIDAQCRCILATCLRLVGPIGGATGGNEGSERLGTDAHEVLKYAWGEGEAAIALYHMPNQQRVV